MKIAHFQRKPFPGSFSVEGLFRNLQIEMRIAGATIEVLELPWYSKGVLPRIRSILWARKHQADVNHITGDVHFVAIGLRKKQTILTILDVEMLGALKGLSRLIFKWIWFQIPVRCSGHITTISEWTKRKLMAECNVNASKVSVIPCAVGKIYKPDPKAGFADPPRILQIGTKSNKNIDRLIEALEGMPCHLHLIGQISESQRTALMKNCINYTVESNLTEEEIYNAYCRADIVSLVSTQEGFGMPIIEAQWVERPVVTSNCTSMPEVAGLGACLVDPFDPASIRRGFERVATDEAYRETLIANGRVNRERFAIEKVTEMYLQLYTKMSELK